MCERERIEEKREQLQFAFIVIQPKQKPTPPNFLEENIIIFATN
jgi:hypothetical protein